MDADIQADETRADTPALDLRLDDGVELIGKYKGSGLQESPYLLRRRDGQVVQVSRLLYLIAGCLDRAKHPDPEDRRPDEVATQVSASFGQEVTAENVVYLVDKKLKPAGLIADPAARSSGPPSKANPLLALRLRVPIVPEKVHRTATRACEFLFWPPWIVLTLVGWVLADIWLVLHQWDNLSEGVRQIVFSPHLFLAITALTITAGIFHEIGHAAAARYGGATPGTMGVGIYLVWPVFYTDLTDAYRLDRRGRLRTDLGGVYFNLVFLLAATLVASVTGYRPLLVFLVILQIETLRQFLPFVRLDGYYVVSDLAGVPNLFAYIQPVLVTLLRRGDEDKQQAARAKLDELHPRARRLIKGWVYVTAPILVVNGVVFLFLAPRLAGALWASGGVQLERMADGGFNPVSFLNGVTALTLLALPLVGMTYVFTRIGRRLWASMATWWQARPLATATVTVAVATLVALQVAVEWPDTFSDALKKAQVAQAVEQAESLEDDYAALPITPAAEAAEVAAPGAPTTTAPPAGAGQEEPTSTSEPRSPGSTSGNGSGVTATVSPKPPSTERPDGTGTTSSSSTSTPGSTDDPAGSGGRPGSQDVPRGNGNGNSNSNGAPSATTTTTRPTTTTTTPRPSIIVDLLDLLF